MQLKDFSELEEMVCVDDRTKRDVPCRLKDIKVRVVHNDARNTFEVVVPGDGGYVMNDWAVSQLLKRLGIPFEFLVERCTPGLAQHILDNFLIQAPSRALLLRLQFAGGSTHVRGVLPASWACFDNRDFLEVAREVADEYRLLVQHYQIGDRAFYCRLLMKESVNAGTGQESDPHNFGVFFRNSEVGYGVPEAQFTVVRQVCSNGVLGLTEEPLMRLHPCSLHSIRKDRLVDRFKAGLKNGLRQRGRIMETIRGARATGVRVKDIEEELRTIHKQYRLSLRNLEIVREAFQREARRGDTTVFTFAGALNRAAQHLPGEEAVKYETAAWSYMSANSSNLRSR